MLRYLPNDEKLKTRRSKVEANLAAAVVSSMAQSVGNRFPEPQMARGIAVTWLHAA